MCECVYVREGACVYKYMCGCINVCAREENASLHHTSSYEINITLHNMTHQIIIIRTIKHDIT